MWKSRGGVRRGVRGIFVLWSTLAAGPSASAGGPMLRLSTLSPVVGEAVEVRLNLPTGEGWRDANVAAFFVRQGAEQWSVPVEPAAGEDAVRLTFDRPGEALVVLSAGRAADRGFSDSWQRTPYCCKAVVRVQPGAAAVDATQATGGGVTGKVGQKVEILPLVDPIGVRVGDDLPVRVYYAGGKRSGVAVTAEVLPADGDDAVRIEAARPTDDAGTTWLPVQRAGRWRVYWTETIDDVPHTAEVLFDVAAVVAPSRGESNGGGER